MPLQSMLVCVLCRAQYAFKSVFSFMGLEMSLQIVCIEETFFAYFAFVFFRMYVFVPIKTDLIFEFLITILARYFSAILHVSFHVLYSRKYFRAFVAPPFFFFVQSSTIDVLSSSLCPSVPVLNHIIKIIR